MGTSDVNHAEFISNEGW